MMPSLLHAVTASLSELKYETTNHTTHIIDIILVKLSTLSTVTQTRRLLCRSKRPRQRCHWLQSKDGSPPQNQQQFAQAC
jgi:uncharacterized protein (DUF779 family)